MPCHDGGLRKGWPLILAPTPHPHARESIPVPPSWLDFAPMGLSGQIWGRNIAEDIGRVGMRAGWDALGVVCTNQLSKITMVLVNVAQWVGCCLTNQKVASLIPGWGTCLGCRFGPPVEHVKETAGQCFSLTLMFLFPSFSLPSLLSKIKYKIIKC